MEQFRTWGSGDKIELWIDCQQGWRDKYFYGKEYCYFHCERILKTGKEKKYRICSKCLKDAKSLDIKKEIEKRSDEILRLIADDEEMEKIRTCAFEIKRLLPRL